MLATQDKLPHAAEKKRHALVHKVFMQEVADEVFRNIVIVARRSANWEAVFAMPSLEAELKAATRMTQSRRATLKPCYGVPSKLAPWKIERMGREGPARQDVAPVSGGDWCWVLGVIACDDDIACQVYSMRFVL